MDSGLSDANCSTNDPCLLSAVCDPDDPGADAVTGCVLAFDDPESGCGDGIIGIVGGGSHTLAWEADGTLHGWGIQNYGLPPEGVLFAQVSAAQAIGQKRRKLGASLPTVPSENKYPGG